MNILIVDDDIVDREHIKRTLNKTNSNYSFIETESVDDGLKAFYLGSFDIILLDYRMPKRDGIELLLELRNSVLNQSIAIIMLSNSEESEIALECVRAGAQDFLLKSEVTSSRLQRAILQSQTRFELEQKLYRSYQEAKKLAELDTLTGIANRYSFEEALKLSISQQPRGVSKLALALFDLDHFKFVNDSHGHDVGDQLLIEVAKRVATCLRENELFARIGGDEFAIILSGLRTIDNATRVTKRLINSLEKPFNISGIELKVSASVGIAIYPDNSVQANELLKFADIAMYRAKKLGKGQICFFEEKMQQQFLERYQIESKLIGAAERKELVLHYQPIFATSTKRLLGVEALIRWKFQKTLLFPDSFINIAESSHVIFEIGRWVIEEAIAQISMWNNQSQQELSISINLSVVQLTDLNLVKFIRATLSTYNVPPKLVEFELTETALLDNSEQAVEIIESISAIGCRIALDDFGTGFSSVSHLQNFPINTVKIDKSLMLASDEPKTRALVKGLSAMLISLNMEIVAEGVEDEGSFNLCKELNIHRVQGYYFSRPLDKENIESDYLNVT